MPQQQPGGDGAQLNPLIAPRSAVAAAAPPPQRPANPFVAAAAVEQPAGASGFAALLNEMSAASRIATKLRQKAATGASSEFATSMDSTPGIPVREMMTQVFVHERARSAKEFALYFLYVCIFSCCVWQITDTNTVNMTNGALSNLLLQQEFQPSLSGRGAFYFKKSFTDIGDYNELRQWLRGVLVEGLYDDDDSGFLLGGKYFYLRGGARIWQLRASDRSCSDMQRSAARGLGNPEAFLRPDGTCYSYWNENTRQTGDWRIVMTNRLVVLPNSSHAKVTCDESTGKWRFNASQTSDLRDALANGSLLQAPAAGDASPPRALPDSCTRTYPFNSAIESSDNRVFAYGQYGWGETDFGLLGGQTSYGRGGYAAFLPPANKLAAAKIVDELVAEPGDGGWIDAQTRLIIVDFSAYNYDTGYITTARLQVETPVTGYFLPSYEFFTYRAALYMTWYDYMRALGEVLLVLGCFRYLFKAAVRIARRRKCSDMQALFELAVQVLVIACIGFWVKVILPITAPGSTLLSTQRTIMTKCTELDKNNGLQATGGALQSSYNSTAYTTPLYPFYGRVSCWADMFPIAQDYKYAVTFAGCVGLLMALKFFSYFSIYRSLSLLWITLARAGVQLLAFTFGFSLLVGGFAFMGQMCFGHSVPGFHTWLSSFSTLLRYPLGDFNYDALSRARPEVSGLFFALYMALVFLVCINMVVAIITTSFEEVSYAAKVDEKWKHAGRSFFGDIISHGRLLFLHAARCVALRRRGGGRGRGARNGGWPVSASSSVAADGGEHGEGSGEPPPDDGDSDWWGAEELGVLCADAYYNELMRVFIETSEYTSRADLMKYAEEVYHSSTAGINYYIGLGELCEMARDPRFLPEPFCSSMHLEQQQQQPQPLGRGTAAGGGAAPPAPVSPRARIPVSRLRSSRGPLSPASPWRGGSSPSPSAGAASAAAPPSRGCCSDAGWGAGCCGGELDAWKSAYINYIDFLVPPLPAEGTPAAARRRRCGGGGGAARAGWCCLYLDVFTPLYRALLVSGLPRGLRAAAAGASHRCAAFRLVQAYKATRRVLMLGRTRRHQWISQRQSSSHADQSNTQRGTWKVWKIGPLRTQRQRVLSIVQESASSFVLYNNEGGAERRLRRRLLLTQVVQLDAPVFDQRRLFAYIEARDRPGEATSGRGASHGGAVAGGGGAVAGSDQYVRFDVPADAMYDLVFASQAERDAFVSTLVHCRTLMQQQARSVALSAGRGGGGVGGASSGAGGGGGDGDLDTPATGVVVSEPALRPSELLARAAAAGGGGLRAAVGAKSPLSASLTAASRGAPLQAITPGSAASSHAAAVAAEPELADAAGREASAHGSIAAALRSSSPPHSPVAGAASSNRSLFDTSGSSPGSISGSRDKAHFQVSAFMPALEPQSFVGGPPSARATRELQAAQNAASRLSIGAGTGLGGGRLPAAAFAPLPQPQPAARVGGLGGALLAAARQHAAQEAAAAARR